MNNNWQNTYEQAFIQLMQTPTGKDLAYKCYIDWDITKACIRFESSAEWTAVKTLIQKFSIGNGKALDLGAGNGISSYALARMGFDVYAVEPNHSPLVGYNAISKMIHETSLTINCVVSTGEQLPFNDRSFSLVYCRQVLHHATNLDQMLRNVSRVLKPDGIFIATREHVVDDHLSLDIFLKNHALYEYSVKENAYKLDEYITAIRENGLITIKIIGPWESAINFYPSTKEERKQTLVDKIKPIVGPASQLIQYIPYIDSVYRKYLELSDRTPGRMYSITAQKKSI